VVRGTTQCHSAPVNLALIQRCSDIAGVMIGEGALAPGPAAWVGTREIAHFDRDGGFDIRLTKQVIRIRRAELRADPRVSLRASGSDWLEVRVDTEADIDFAVSLVTHAVAANIPTAKPGLPPTGAALDRRRRFH
jgi:hypothetical protein